MNIGLIQLLDKVLNSKGQSLSKTNEYMYWSPFVQHHKPKLQVNIQTGKWHCWVSNKKGKSILQLLRKAGASQDKIAEAKTYVKDVTYVSAEKSVSILKLPAEYVRLDQSNNNSIIKRHAAAYLKKRGVSITDINKYNIGYCEGGLYNNMIIIPTYDADGRLNYFTARSFEKEAFVKYRNPQASRDIIPNEHFINWNLPIILCEGLFDAMAIKRNAIPLLGKNIKSNLMKKIVTCVVNKIYIELYRDAIKQALNFCEKLMAEGKEVYLVDLQDKDPSEMGFENFTKLIQKTVPLTYYDLMEQKLSL